jgi:hypothetical protein
MKPITEKYFAQVQARCGDADGAIAALPHLLEVPGGITPAELRFSSFFDPLRKDARFEAILKNPPTTRY